MLLKYLNGYRVAVLFSDFFILFDRTNKQEHGVVVMQGSYTAAKK